MEQTEIAALFQEFAAPLAGYAASLAKRGEGAGFLARSLWTAMIGGPELEEETWLVFKKHAVLDDESLQLIKDVYLAQMKPVVSEKQLVALRHRYLAHHKE